MGYPIPLSNYMNSRVHFLRKTGETLLACLMLLAGVPLSWAGEAPDQRLIRSLSPEEGPVNIQADEVIYNYRTRIVTLRGTVLVIQGDAKLEADEVILHTEDNSGEAKGHVRYYHGQDRLTGDSIRFFMQTRQGVVINGQLFLEKQHFYINGDRIEKVGESEYLIERGSFTTCDGAKPDWSFRGRKIDITVGGYATAENVTFRVREVPIFYLPYLIYPVKRERQTGFLLPHPGHSSRDGLLLDLPFFWAISPSADATFTPRYLSRRGPGMDAEFRTVLSPVSRGKVEINYLDDQTREGDVDFGLFRRANSNRWRILGWSEMEKGQPVSAFMRLNLVGDRDFLQEFGKGQDRYVPYLESGGEVQWKADRTVIRPGVRYFQDLTVAKDKAAFQSLPEVEIQTFSGPVSQPLYGSFLGAFRHSWREEGSRGLSGEVEPTLFIPLQWKNYLTVVPEFSFREAADYVEEDPLESDEAFHQGLAKASIKILTQVERIFSPGWLGIGRLRHVIEPSVTYLWIERIHGEDRRRLPSYSLPLGFAGEAPDLFLDLAEEQHALWFGLASRLEGQGGAGTASLASLRILQGYGLKDFDSLVDGDDEKRRWSDLYGEIVFRPLPFIDLGGAIRYDHRRGDMVSSNARMGLVDPRKDSAYLEWRNQRAMGGEDKINTLNTDVRLNLVGGLSFLYSGIYDQVQRIVVKNEFSVEYQPQCWLARLTLSETAGQEGQKTDRRIMLFLSLYGLGPAGQFATGF